MRRNLLTKNCGSSGQRNIPRLRRFIIGSRFTADLNAGDVLRIWHGLDGSCRLMGAIVDNPAYDERNKRREYQQRSQAVTVACIVLYWSVFTLGPRRGE